MPTIDVNGTTLFYEEQGPKDAPVLATTCISRLCAI